MAWVGWYQKIPFWILSDLTMMEVVVTSGPTRRAKLLQSNRHHQQTNTQLFAGQILFLSPNQRCQNTEGKVFILEKNLTNILLTKVVGDDL